MDNIGFLIAYTTQFPKMYRFANLPKMPTKLHSEPDYDVDKLTDKDAGLSEPIRKVVTGMEPKVMCMMLKVNIAF